MCLTHCPLHGVSSSAAVQREQRWAGTSRQAQATLPSQAQAGTSSIGQGCLPKLYLLLQHSIQVNPFAAGLFPDPPVFHTRIKATTASSDVAPPLLFPPRPSATRCSRPTYLLLTGTRVVRTYVYCTTVPVVPLGYSHAGLHVPLHVGLPTLRSTRVGTYPVKGTTFVRCV